MDTKTFHSVVCVVSIALFPLLFRTGVSAAEPASISLSDAVRLALEKNPELVAYSWDIRAAEARQLQARLRPNPEFSVSLEDVPLGGGADPAPPVSIQSSENEVTVSLSQLVELGGKRAKRIALAARDRDVAAWNYEIVRADVLRDVAQAFAGVLAAQEHAALDVELVQLAEQVLKSVTARVEAGRVSPLDKTKAETALAHAQVESSRSERVLAAERISLAALWGETEPAFGQAEGKLDTVRRVLPWNELTMRLKELPDVARWQAELAKRELAVKVERAKAVSDVNVSLGFRRTGLSYSGTNEEGAEHSLVACFSIPLPLFNRNQGAIKEAEHLAAKARDEKWAMEVRIDASMKAAHQELCGTYETLVSLKERILPAAERTFEATNEAYKQGKFGFLDVLDSQRTLFEARQEYLEALTAYHRNVAELERLCGAPLWSEETAPAAASKEKPGNE